jgi:hypothetical protein
MENPIAAIESIAQTVRLVFFRTGLDVAPIWFGGTGFFVSFDSQIFFVTAKHVVTGHEHNQILVYSNDRMKKPVMLLKGIEPTPFSDGRDSGDIVVYPVKFMAAHRQLKHRLIAFPLNAEPNGWKLHPHELEFFIYGFPKCEAELDYSTQILKSKRCMIFGQYLEQVPGERVHVLRFDEIVVAQDINGYSGAPVFAHRKVIGVPSEVIFVGIVVRGTAKSRRVRFVDASIVLNLLKVGSSSEYHSVVFQK